MMHVLSYPVIAESNNILLFLFTFLYKFFNHFFLIIHIFFGKCALTYFFTYVSISKRESFDLVNAIEHLIFDQWK